jgi:putative addiction module killer protein
MGYRIGKAIGARPAPAGVVRLIDDPLYVNYSSHMSYDAKPRTVLVTEAFTDWLDGTKDIRGRKAVAKRIARLAMGNLGDVKRFDGIGELRIDFGPGYRVYFVERDDVVVILLCGGDKSSQKKDIAKAKKMAEELEDGTQNDTV